MGHKDFTHNIARMAYYNGMPPAPLKVEIGKEPTWVLGEGKDKIELISTDDFGATVYQYTALEDLEFPRHFHLNKELVMLVKGSIEVTHLRHDSNKKVSKVLEEGESITFLPYDDHDAVFKAGTQILIAYHPPFEDGDWKAHIPDE